MKDLKEHLEYSDHKYRSAKEKIKRSYLEHTYDAMELADDTGNSRREAEKQVLGYISMGNVNLAKELVRSVENSSEVIPVGNLSDDPVHQARYVIVSALTLFTREAIDAGLPEHLAYNISDSYIREIDRIKNTEEIYAMFFQSFIDFTQAVNDWRVRAARPEIRVCCEYISAHLHEKVTIEDLSRVSNLSPTYISDVFQKELGIRPKQYILREKMNYAAYILRTTDAPIAEVSSLLAFSGHSAFTVQFEKEYGLKPSVYRRRFFNKSSAVQESDH